MFVFAFRPSCIARLQACRPAWNRSCSTFAPSLMQVGGCPVHLLNPRQQPFCAWRTGRDLRINGCPLSRREMDNGQRTPRSWRADKRLQGGCNRQARRAAGNGGSHLESLASITAINTTMTLTVTMCSCLPSTLQYLIPSSESPYAT